MTLLSESPTVLPIHRKILAFSFIGWIFDFYDLLLLSFLISPSVTSIVKDLALTPNQIAILLGTPLAFTAVGGFIGGAMADRFGRKPLLMATILVYSVGTLAAGLSIGFWTLLAARAVTGIGVGGEWAVAHALVGETVPPAVRGRYGSYLQSGSAFARFFASMMGNLLAPVIGWRLAFMLSALPALLVVFIRREMPESDVWLLSVKDGVNARLGYVAALSERTGGILWKVKPGGPLRGAPTVSGDTVYAMSQDNQLYSLKASDGSLNWSAAASLEIAGVFGSGSPAVGQGTVIAGFSSGELNAYRYENGRLVWQDALQRTSIRTSVSSLNDVDADPVIDNGQVIAVGQGGRMVSLDLITGQRQWELNIAGISTPWVAGDWVFVATADAKLVCVNRMTGKIRWINPMPAFRRPKTQRGQIDYSGPILAGGRLIVASSGGSVLSFDPNNGSYQSQFSVGAPISVAPAVAGGMLYVLDDNGRLHGYR